MQDFTCDWIYRTSPTTVEPGRDVSAALPPQGIPVVLLCHGVSLNVQCCDVSGDVYVFPFVWYL